MYSLSYFMYSLSYFKKGFDLYKNENEKAEVKLKLIGCLGNSSLCHVWNQSMLKQKKMSYADGISY